MADGTAADVFVADFERRSGGAVLHGVRILTDVDVVEVQ